MTLSRDTLIYDGDCKFCCRCVEWCKANVKDIEHIEFIPYQLLSKSNPEQLQENYKNCIRVIGEELISECQQSIQLVTGTGELHKAANAAITVLAHDKRYQILDTLYSKLPGFSLIAELAYKLVAKNRMLASKFIIPLLEKLTNVN